MQNPWLTVIGIGEDGFDSLSPTAQQALHNAQIIYGGDRHLAFLPKTVTAQTHRWRSPIQNSITELLTHSPNPVCVLASGDPLCYGIGNTLLRHIPREELQILPHLSAFTLTAARLGWSTADIETASLCARELHLLRPKLYPNAKLLLLSNDHTTPNLVCRQLTEWGYGETTVQVFEHLGGPKEQQFSTLAKTGFPNSIAPLNTIALQCPDLQTLQTQTLPISPFSILNSQFSIPDTSYQHDGQLTKQEIRTLTLAALAPFPGQHLWDIGAGCGSIAIEWMRTHPRCTALAVESRSDRIANIIHNAKTLGVPNLKTLQGQAPEILQTPDQTPDQLLGQTLLEPNPDAIFIGGGITRSHLFETCWTALKPGGTLVSNGVTLETETKLFQLQQQYGGSLTRIQIQRAEPIGSFLGWKSLSPITQWQVTKPTI
jgi:precorrin-6B C5,15-methyltransferase / cobalt-precorrin-6B C5,C15-methyltransferase